MRKHRRVIHLITLSTALAAPLVPALPYEAKDGTRCQITEQHTIAERRIIIRPYRTLYRDREVTVTIAGCHFGNEVSLSYGPWSTPLPFGR